MLVKEESWIFQKYGKKSTRHSGNHRNIELLLRTIKSVNQLSLYDFIAHWSKTLDEEDTSEAPPSDDSDSSGTQNAIQMLETRRLQKEDYNVSRECQRLQDEFLTEIKAALQTKFIRANKDVKIRINNSKEVKIVTALLFAKQEMIRRAAGRLVVKLRLRRPHHDRMMVSFFKIRRSAVNAIFFAAHAVSDCRNVVPTIRRGVFTEYTSGACITNTTVFSSAQITHVLVTHELNDSRCLSCSIFERMKMVCHHLDSTIFSKTTLYTKNLFQKLHCRKASLKNHSRTSITRVTETCEETLPHR